MQYLDLERKPEDRVLGEPVLDPFTESEDLTEEEDKELKSKTTVDKDFKHVFRPEDIE